MGKLSILKLIFSISVIVLSLMLISCSAKLTDYPQDKFKFDIKNYFDGDVIAWGMVQDYSNKVTRRFCVEINGTWQDNKGVLAEKFYFNDGEISYRNWQLTKQYDGSYKGTAEDVIGTAIGKHQGFAFQFQYVLLLKLDNESYEVAMDDWMYQLDRHRVINKTAINKLGGNIANVTLFFDKSLPSQTCG
jgi:hypothetical protein